MTISLPVPVHSYRISGGKDKNIYYPQITLVSNHTLMREINQSIIEKVQSLIDLQSSNATATIEEMLGTFDLKNNQKEVLSFTFSNYTYYQQAAHGMTYIKSLTFDIKNEKQYQLKDLFKADADYTSKLSKIIQKQINKREIPLLNEFTGIQPNQDFYIADKTLVIYFQLYELTPYVFGFPIFPISVYDLADIIDENGPLGRMAVNN